jgi:hypothetical protein
VAARRDYPDSTLTAVGLAAHPAHVGLESARISARLLSEVIPACHEAVSSGVADLLVQRPVSPSALNVVAMSTIRSISQNQLPSRGGRSGPIRRGHCLKRAQASSSAQAPISRFAFRLAAPAPG